MHMMTGFTGQEAMKAMLGNSEASPKTKSSETNDASNVKIET